MTKDKDEGSALPCKEELKQNVQANPILGGLHNTPCPNCGYCPCCGRTIGNYPQYPIYPMYPTLPLYQVYC